MKSKAAKQIAIKLKVLKIFSFIKVLC